MRCAAQNGSCRNALNSSYYWNVGLMVLRWRADRPLSCTASYASAVLKSEGLSLTDVLKTTIFLTDLGNFQIVNEIYGSYFSSEPPARSTVQVSALPKGAKIEIEVIALANRGAVASDTSG
jgi:Putative translation initiation inhibitor, yjgF family